MRATCVGLVECNLFTWAGLPVHGRALAAQGTWIKQMPARLKTQGEKKREEAR